MAVYRFSPYHFNADRLGIELTGPIPLYRDLYDLSDAELNSLVYYFGYRHADGREPESYIGDLRSALAQWRAANEREATLTYYVGPGFVEILDTRFEHSKRYVMKGADAAIYLACDQGRTINALADDQSLRECGVSENDIKAFLDDCVEMRLMYRENDKYLSLAVGTGRQLPSEKAAAVTEAAKLFLLSRVQRSCAELSVDRST